MKVFFDTNVYVAEALIGGAAADLIAATERARWRIVCNTHVLNEVVRVLAVYKRLPPAFAARTKRHVARRSTIVDAPPNPRHDVPADPADSPILQSAVAAGADYLVSNDRHLLAQNPHEGLRILSMTDFFSMLVDQGLLPRS